MIASLNTNLIAAGVTDAKFALVGYGNSLAGNQNSGRTLTDFTNVAGFQAADDNLVISGGTEDGYAGINYAFNNLTFRAGAAQNFILVTDEDRDNTDNAVTYASILQALQARGALLNVVVDNPFTASGTALGERPLASTTRASATRPMAPVASRRSPAVWSPSPSRPPSRPSSLARSSSSRRRACRIPARRSCCSSAASRSSRVSAVGSRPKSTYPLGAKGRASRLCLLCVRMGQRSSSIDPDSRSQTWERGRPRPHRSGHADAGVRAPRAAPQRPRKSGCLGRQPLFQGGLFPTGFILAWIRTRSRHREPQGRPRRRVRVILPLPVSLRQKTIGRDLVGLELDGLVKYCSARSRVFARLLSAEQPQSRKADRTGRSTRNKGRSFMMEKAQPGPDAGRQTIDRQSCRRENACCIRFSCRGVEWRRPHRDGQKHGAPDVVAAPALR